MALPYLFEFWALEHQVPPEGDWTNWIVMGGRGAGKTRAGAEWVRAQIEGDRPMQAGRCRRMALVGETVDQVREVMIFGESGIMACSPPDRRPDWQASRKRLVWPNGATAQVFSAHDPEGLRGPQFDGAWADEYGCAAVDKGTNQPNKFLDAKSSESSLPRHSTGRRDELIQLQYLRAMAGYWTDPANNPVSEEYDGPMLDWDHSCAWAWDARPYPFFPNNRALWGDGENYARGHWLNGRVSGRTLASVVDEVTARAGLVHTDTGGLHGYLRGYLVDQVEEARGALQPLMLRYGFDAIERDGLLQFRMRDGRADAVLDPDWLVRDAELDGVIEQTRGSEVEQAGRVRLRFVEADADFAVIAEEAILPDDSTHAVATSEMPLAMTRAEGRETVVRWLSEARVSTDTVRLALPLSRLGTGAGDVIALPEEGGQGLYRIDRVEQMARTQRAEAVRIEPETYRPVDFGDEPAQVRAFTAPGPVTPLFLDLPLMTGEEVPHAPYIAVTADPWPGAAALYASDVDADYALNRLLNQPTPVGLTETPLIAACPARIDKGEGLLVRMVGGELQSVGDAAFLSGANLCAIGDGTPDGWELFQFRDADLVGEETYLLHHRLRGQLGTEGAMRKVWPAGSIIVRLDGSPVQIDMPEARRGLARHYRIGPADRPVDDPSYQGAVAAFDGIGLRPYAPVHLRHGMDAGGDRHFGWIRRTRIGGDRWDTPEVPLGEEREAYVLRVMQGPQVLREVTVGAPEWTYTTAAQAQDGITGPFTVQVAQVSALYGAGAVATLGIG